jgi:hypothetical protein
MFSDYSTLPGLTGSRHRLSNRQTHVSNEIVLEGIGQYRNSDLEVKSLDQQ